MKKRLVRHMYQTGFRSLEDYLRALDHDPALLEEHERVLAVTISRFYRDKILWRTLEDRVLPRLIQEAGPAVLVWSAGCGCGEEPYTLKMVWERLGERQGTLPELVVWATDMNPEAIEKARLGAYPRSTLKDLPASWRAAFFTEQGDRFTVSDRLKRGIRWKRHHLLREDPPHASFHLVLLRNSILTYYGDALKQRAFSNVVGALAPGGVLAVGAHEELPPGNAGFVPLDPHGRLFQKSGR